MKNFVSPGHHVTVTLTAVAVSGAFVSEGDLSGVAQEDGAIGDDIVLVRSGIFELPKLEAQAWTQGQKVYWDSGNDHFTTVASGNDLRGVASAAAADPSTVGQVLLDGMIR